LIFNHYKTDYLGAVYDQSKWNWQAYWQVAYKPAAGWNIEVSGYYTTRFLQEFILIDPLGTLNLAVQKSFWDKKGKLTLNFSDLLWTEKTRASIEYQYIHVGLQSMQETRNIRLGFSYSFGNQKLKAVRTRATASDAESSRVKTN